MAKKNEFQDLVDLLARHGQDHLLRFYDRLTADQQAGLRRQISQIPWDQIDRWITETVLQDKPVSLPKSIEPAPYYPVQPGDEKQAAWYDKARAHGEDLIRAGKTAGFVVAGGQGTRLGFDGPKGAFPASPVRGKCLFQLFAEDLLTTAKRYGVSIPFYIMTSPLNDAQTRELFEQHDFFGLPAADVFIFQQGTLPNFSFDGKILMAAPDTIACSPDGHGGSLRALYHSGATADMARRGIEILSYWQVDNPLIHPIDPLFIGLHALEGAEMSTKALKKTGPEEKVGNLCLADGKMTVIEYSDLPDELAHATRPDGSLVFELGSIGIHVINRSFIKTLNADGFSLPLHRAIKKIPYLDDQGNPITPTEPNGVKLETFVFDALPLAERSVILETERSEEFAPIKNATGVDSAESSRAMMIARAARWLERAGVKVPRRDDGEPDCVLEIAPSRAQWAEDLTGRLDNLPPIEPGQKLYLE